MRRLPWELLALPALGVARLLPETGGGLWFRLAAATAVLLLPGALIARRLRTPRFSSELAWSLGALFVATAVMFAVHSSLGLALILLSLIAAVALAFGVARTFRQGQASGLSLAWVGVAAAGLGFGIALWFLMRHLTGGDDLFHLARVRKLDD